ncbi:Protein unc-93 A [Mactra antiquata]
MSDSSTSSNNSRPETIEKIGLITKDVTRIDGAGETSDALHPSQRLPPMKKSLIIKNLLVMSFAFMFLFTAFQSLQNLQSSLNKEEGLGTVSLSVIYVFGMLAGLVLPPLAISRLGCKWTVAASMICYIVFMCANLYATWWTMIPASVIIGTGAATLWAAKCTYLTQMADWYSQLTNAPKDGTLSTFFGVFFLMFQTSQIWGNLISSGIFSLQLPENSTVNEDVLKTCGANYCPSDYENNTNLDRPNMTKIYIVCGTYVGCACLALIIVCLLLDNITHETDTKDKTTKQLVLAIVQHFYQSKYQKLLVPLTIYSGVQQAFVAGEFTRSFISCALGVWNVGYVMIAYGVADATCSLIIGRLVKHTGFIPWFVTVFLLHGGTMIAFLIWRPHPDHVVLFYVFAVFWGIGDAIIQTLINALYGYLFMEKPESAFASYRLCESAGFILAFGYSGYVCTNIKIHVTLVLLTIGVALYGVVAVLDRRDKKIKIRGAKL